jgi:hypothetical protein
MEPIKGQSVISTLKYTSIFFYPVKYDATKICEIGIGEGASLKMFRDYFPKSIVLWN